MLTNLINLNLLVLLLLISGGLDAQSGKIIVHESPEVSEIVEKHKQVNKEVSKADGYRIQIFSVSGAGSKNRAEMTRADFLLKFPNTNVYIVYSEPYYKVRVGNFRSKIEALQMLQYYKEVYPYAFTVIDLIEVVQLVD